MAIVITCLSVGMIFILVEQMFPKGAFGIPGLIVLGAGIVMAYRTFDTTTAHMILAGTLCTLLVSFLLWLRFFPQSRVGKRLTTTVSVGEPDTRVRQWVGKAGVAQTDLRPVGKAIIDGQPVDVVARAGFVEKGTSLKVVEAGGNRVLVEVLSQDEPVVPTES